jgi:hypothetical protein
LKGLRPGLRDLFATRRRRDLDDGQRRKAEQLLAMRALATRGVQVRLDK